MRRQQCSGVVWRTGVAGGVIVWPGTPPLYWQCAAAAAVNGRAVTINTAVVPYNSGRRGGGCVLCLAEGRLVRYGFVYGGLVG